MRSDLTKKEIQIRNRIFNIGFSVGGKHPGGAVPTCSALSAVSVQNLAQMLTEHGIYPAFYSKGNDQLYPYDAGLWSLDARAIKKLRVIYDPQHLSDKVGVTPSTLFSWSALAIGFRGDHHLTPNLKLPPTARVSRRFLSLETVIFYFATQSAHWENEAMAFKAKTSISNLLDIKCVPPQVKGDVSLSLILEDWQGQRSDTETTLNRARIPKVGHNLRDYNPGPFIPDEIKITPDMPLEKMMSAIEKANALLQERQVVEQQESVRKAFLEKARIVQAEIRSPDTAVYEVRILSPEGKELSYRLVE